MDRIPITPGQEIVQGFLGRSIRFSKGYDQELSPASEELRQLAVTAHAFRNELGLNDLDDFTAQN